MKTNTNINLLEDLSSADKKAVVKRIYQLRSDILHLTQEQFAKHTGISQSYLSQLESGSKEIYKSTVCHICAALQINLDWLLSGTGQPFISDTPISTANILENSKRPVALFDLQKAFSLNDSDMEFISRYVNLPLKERSGFINALSVIATTFKD